KVFSSVKSSAVGWSTRPSVPLFFLAAFPLNADALFLCQNSNNINIHASHHSVRHLFDRRLDVLAQLHAQLRHVLTVSHAHAHGDVQRAVFPLLNVNALRQITRLAGVTRAFFLLAAHL